MVQNSDQILWGLIFRRDLTETEERELFSLLDTLGQVSCSGEGKDSSTWLSSKDGSFSVASFYLALAQEDQSVSPLNSLWKMKVPPQVAVFGWFAFRGRFLTMDNLCRQNVIIVNACLICLQLQESIDHLLLK